MRMMMAVIVAIFLLVPSITVDAASDDLIGISSYGELMGIGTVLPSDGDYILTDDIVLPSLGTMYITVGTDIDDVTLTVTADGYGADDDVASLTVMVNGEMRSVRHDVPTVSYPSSAIRDENLLSVTLDGMRSVDVVPSDRFRDGDVISLGIGGNVDTVIPEFRGTFDGAGHTISGIRTLGERASLFSSSDGATFRNLTLNGSFISYVMTDHTFEDGSATYDVASDASALVSVAKDTRFERVNIVSDIVSVLYSSSMIGQGGADGLSFDTDCMRLSVTGGLVAKSTGCDFISCTTSGKFTSFVGSRTTLDVAVRPTSVDTLSDTKQNTSMTVCGGITGSSENDRFAYCVSTADIVTIRHDRMDSTDTITGTGFDDGNRCQSIAYSGSLTGLMEGATVFGCDMVCDRTDIGVTEVEVPGTYISETFSGCIAGASEGSAISGCHTLDGMPLASSADDTVTDVSSEMTMPDCGFVLTLNDDVPFTVEGMDDEGKIHMDGMCTVLGRGPTGGEYDVTCDNGGVIVTDDALIVNPEFDWSGFRYKNMGSEIREQGNPLSADLVILVVSCAVAVTLTAFVALSLRRL